MSASHKQVINITYRGGNSPPVYVAGEFSDPQWQLIELERVTTHRNDKDLKDITFTKSIKMAEGTYQYKFRVGDGESQHWECDPQSKIVTREDGIQNNVLTVSPTLNTSPSSVRERAQRDHRAWGLSQGDAQNSAELLSTVRSGEDSANANVEARKYISPLMKAADQAEDEDRTIEYIPSRKVPLNSPPMSPEFLQSHKPRDTTSESHNKLLSSQPDLKLNVGIVQPNDAEEFSEYSEPSPLLPHEQGSPVSTHLQPTSPHRRSRKGSSAYDFKKDRRGSIVSPAATERHLHDPSIEIFPSSKEGILERVKTLQSELEEDDCSHLDHVTQSQDHGSSHRLNSFEGANRNSGYQVLGRKQSPTHNGMSLEPIPQEPSALDGTDALSLSSYKTAASQAYLGSANARYSSHSEVLTQSRSRNLTPLIPVRRSSLDKLVVSASKVPQHITNGEHKETLLKKRTQAQVEQELNTKPEHDGGGRVYGDSAASSTSTKDSRTKSPVTTNTHKIRSRYRQRTSSSKSLVSTSCSTSSHSRSSSVRKDNSGNEAWYRRVLLWFKQMLALLLRKKKHS